MTADPTRSASSPSLRIEARGDPRRRTFHTLDGLRGIAALLIVVRHVGYLAHTLRFPESFLAVDLFFVLSGFVIAHAYGPRLRRGGFLGRFMAIRLIRLYPLYLLGLALGVAYHLGRLRLGHQGWTFRTLGEAALFGLLMIQSGPAPGIAALNLPSWTLLPELVANLAYAVSARALTTPRLLGAMALGAVGLAGCEAEYGTLNLGWSLEQAPVIAARLLYSFCAGVLLFRLLGDRARPRPALAWACLAVVAVALMATPAPAQSPLYELVMVLAVFPMLVWVAGQCEPGRSGARVFRFLGLTSYAVYTLHDPLGSLTGAVLANAFHFAPADVFPWALLGFLVALLPVAWGVDVLYDTPLRAWLARTTLRRLDPATAQRASQGQGGD